VKTARASVLNELEDSSGMPWSTMLFFRWLIGEFFKVFLKNCYADDALHFLDLTEQKEGKGVLIKSG